MKSLIGGKSPKIGSSHSEKLSDVSSDENSSNLSNGLEADITSLNQDIVESKNLTGAEKLSLTTVLQPGEDIKNYELEISNLLDQMVISLKEINTKIGEYEGLIEKIYKFLKTKYSSTLSESDIDDIQNFIIQSCCSLTQQYSKLGTCRKRKVYNAENCKQAGVKKRRVVQDEEFKE
ncbi:unnamed protein product [Brugia timori]|uniref:Movement protein n=1 Tax=Brugia timori TaxID=42155 RepID=A0A0R3QSP6_9BILA|nr:unnamed protein product [Brugia timori]